MLESRLCIVVGENKFLSDLWRVFIPEMTPSTHWNKSSLVRPSTSVISLGATILWNRIKTLLSTQTPGFRGVEGKARDCTGATLSQSCVVFIYHGEVSIKLGIDARGHIRIVSSGVV